MGRSRKKSVEILKHEAALFIEEKRKYEREKDTYERAKERFYDSAATLFPNGLSSITLDYSISDRLKQLYRVTKVQRENIVWDIPRLKTRLSKKALDRILTRRYNVDDIKGLAQYVKSLGGDAKTFKRFIRVEEEVNEKALEIAIERGKMTQQSLKGCYEVEQSEPYYTVREIER